jgi:hypothetical protein
MSEDNLPVNTEKPSLAEWLEDFLPFQIPQIPMLRTANNLDKALARIVAASGENIGTRIDRSTAKASATSDAEKDVIAAAGDLATRQIMSGSGLAERAISYTFRESILKQENREKIVELACEELKNDKSNVDANMDIGPEWLNHFARFAENVSSDDLRSLWSKILAGEIKRPGTISIRALQQISIMSRDDAALIHTTLSFAVGAFIFRDGYTEEKSLGEAMACEHLGILSGVEGLLSMKPKLKADNPIHFISGRLGISLTPEKDVTISIPAYPLSAFGRELLTIAGELAPQEPYMRNFAAFLKKQNAGAVKFLRLGTEAPDGSHPIISQEDV